MPFLELTPTTVEKREKKKKKDTSVCNKALHFSLRDKERKVPPCHNALNIKLILCLNYFNSFVSE